MQLPCRRLRRPRRVLRQWPAASCSAAMASRLAVSFDRPRLGMPPRPPRPPRSPRQRRPRSRTATCPVVPRELSEGLAKPPRCRVRDAGLCRPSKQRRIPRSAPAAPQSGMANPCPMPVHLPGELRNALASRKRHPDAGGLPGRRALHAGFPPAVRFPGLSALPPTMPRKAARKWLHPTMRHHGGTTAACLAFRTGAALQRRLGRCHYLLSRHAHALTQEDRAALRQSRR